MSSPVQTETVELKPFRVILPAHRNGIMNSRLLLSLWLAFALLFAQQGAALHALAHLTDSVPAQSQQEKHLPHSTACDKCVVYAGIGSAASSAPLAFCVQEAADVLAAAVIFLLLPTPLHLYRSRAPPRQE